MPASDPQIVTLLLIHRPATWGLYQMAQRPDDLFRDLAPDILELPGHPAGPTRPTGGPPMTLLDSANPVAGSRVPPSIRLDDLVAATGGRLLGPTTVTHFTTAAVDSRHVIPGSLLRGAARRAGRWPRLRGRGRRQRRLRRPGRAAGHAPGGIDVALVQVPDTLAALQELAAWWRSRSAVRVVGITGSTGKTIAKEIVADVLARTRTVLRNEGNLNSETGLPMTLLRLEPAHEVAVLEMSMYTEGEIARLAEIARPEVGVVLAVHPTHLERAGSIEAIARAKSELPAALPAGRAGGPECR